MVLVCRAILALMMDLLVCYLWGEAVLGNFYKRICHPFTNLLVDAPNKLTPIIG